MATTQELWLQQNSDKQRQLNNLANAEYWAKRERQQRELYMMEEAQQQRELEKIYAEMYRYAEDEINRFYGKYADAEGIDITEAKKRVTQADIEAYEALAKEYVKNKDFSDRANAEMRLYNATMKINRLEMLKARIGVYLVAGINDIDDYYEKVITDRTRREIERQAGILGETVSVADTTKRAENIVNASFFNATYSERIWSHQDRLRSMISIELQRGLIAGVGSREMASRIKREFDVSLADAHRLMVTELRRVQTDVAMDSYKQSGVEKYVYMAVNPRACPICREIDGKVFKVADAEPAKNAPPMHPRCHCTTAPYVDEDEYNAWLNYLSQGGSTSDWNNMTEVEKQKWKQPSASPTEQKQEPQSAPPSPISSTEQLEKDMENALADAYEYHRIKNNLNASTYEEIKNNGAISVDLKGLSEETAKAITNTLGRLVREYDTTLQTIKVGTLDGNESAFASTYHNYSIDNSTIVINPLKCASYDTLMGRLTACRDQKWLVDTDMLSEYVGTHEFAHTLVDNMSNLNEKTNWLGADYGKVKRVRKEINALYNDYLGELAEYERQAKEYADIANETFDFEIGRKAIEAEKKADALRISKYSLENPDEFMAEAFAYAKIGAGKNKYADRVLEVIDSNYKR